MGLDDLLLQANGCELRRLRLDGTWEVILSISPGATRLNKDPSKYSYNLIEHPSFVYVAHSADISDAALYQCLPMWENYNFEGSAKAKQYTSALVISKITLFHYNWGLHIYISSELLGV